jgi:hypothetical protein
MSEKPNKPVRQTGKRRRRIKNPNVQPSMKPLAGELIEPQQMTVDDGIADVENEAAISLTRIRARGRGR